MSEVAKHVAFIVDGNRRWAKEQKMPFYDAYLIAGQTLVDNVCFAANQGVKAVTAFLFSTENWKRDAGEIKAVFKAFSEILYEHTPTFKQNGIKTHAIGDICKLPMEVQKAINFSIQETADIVSTTDFVVAFNYGGRWDIVNALQKVMETQNNGSLKGIDEVSFSKYLSTEPFGDPDLLIRTGNQRRISNFLMWQLAYSELYFSELMWPDFTPNQFQHALTDFARRERRKGA